MSGPGLQAVRVVGGLIPPGLFAKIQTRDVRAPESLTASSYHLSGRETIPDAANRSWTYLRGAWQDWRAFVAAQPLGTPGTGPARERWLLVLMRELGYGQLPALRGGINVDGVEYPVSHEWQNVPVHLLGPGVDLDRRNPGVAGAARAPQAMVQELLNRSEPHLWAVLSNGQRLRLLRDSTSLAGSAYVEFDLESIFDGELFAEFLLLWQLCHVSRMEKRGGPDAPAAACWIEAWRGEAVEGGTRALNQLRDGVETALTSLGSGFLAHKDNGWLLDALRTGELSTAAYHRALLRLVYRLLFLSVAEDRGVLLYDASPETADRYARYFSVGRLRRLSRIRAGGPHGDLWQALTVVLRGLGGDGLPALGLPALAGLFDPDDQPLDEPGGAKVDHLLACSLANNALLPAMRQLGWIYGKADRMQPVDYRNLGAEELGSVYESLLELVPRLDLTGRAFALEHVAGNERKTTGSCYTPASLVSALLDSALDPLLDDAQKNAVDNAHAVQRLLSLTVCDPACGSGHLLVAAARRIARRVAQLRSGDEEPTPSEVQHALREVVGSCIYGVDVNPFAAELAKVSLWMEALEPGKPLGFLDARIRVGNSLLGTTPALLAGDVPDEAFKELEGDDKKIAAATRKLNKEERQGQIGLWENELVLSNAELAQQRAGLVALADGPTEVRTQAQAWQRYDSDDRQLTIQRTQADAWCAAFVWRLSPDGPEAPTSSIVRGFASDPNSQSANIRAEIARLAAEYRFFHWHLEFPEILKVKPGDPSQRSPHGWTGGFSCFLGNPPWERVKLQEPEFFAARSPEIARERKAVRQRMIRALQDSNSPIDRELHKEFVEAKHFSEAESSFLRTSDRFPFTGRGDVNTYAVFAETFRDLTAQDGRAGIIIPTGIATDENSQFFFGNLVEQHSLVSLFDFRNKGFFVDAASAQGNRFCLLTIKRDSLIAPISIAFRCETLNDTMNPDRKLELTPDEIMLLNPNTKTCPIFKSRRDADLTLQIYSNSVVLLRDETEDRHDANPYSVRLKRMFDMSTDADLFVEREQIEERSYLRRGNRVDRGEDVLVPLYEGKMLHHYDHRFGDYAAFTARQGRSARALPTPSDRQHDDPSFCVTPKYWIAESEVTDWFRRHGRGPHGWILGWRKIASGLDERITIASAFPKVAVGDSELLILTPNAAILQAILSSFVLDYVARQKVGGTNFTYNYFKQLAVPPLGVFKERCSWEADHSVSAWLLPRLLELNYTSFEMAEYAAELTDSGEPFRWNMERREPLMRELDAALFHIFGIDRSDTSYILDTFPTTKANDEADHGEYRTKRLILEMYDRMAEAIRSGEPYKTPLDPPPGHGPRHPTKQEGQ